MTIKKFQGRTQDEAIAKAKAELGENAVIMNVKEVRRADETVILQVDGMGMGE